MTWYGVPNVMEHQADPVMNGLLADASEPIDRKTSRSICDAVGERLQQNLPPQSLSPSPYLQQLLDRLHKQDRQDGGRVR
jgi:hypothetical protein